MALWSIKCWDDVGGPEDGIISKEYRVTVEAETEDEAWNKCREMGEITCYWYDEWGAPHKDIRPANQEEIEMWNFNKMVDEEYFATYGKYSGEE